MQLVVVMSVIPSLETHRMQVRNRVVVSFHNLYTTPLVPSAPPTAVIVLEDTFISINLQWEAVDCINRNGNTTGYSLLIGNMENTLYRDSSGTGVTLSGLRPSLPTQFKLQL